MRARVARHHQPRMTAAAVVPEFLMNAGGVVAQIDVVVERLARIGCRRIGPPYGRVTQVGELVVSARAAIGTGNAQRWPSMQIRLGAGAAVVEQGGGGVAVGPHGGRDL